MVISGSMNSVQSKCSIEIELAPFHGSINHKQIAMSDLRSLNSYQSTSCSPFVSSKHTVPNHTQIISIEGNIGAGKSTFLNLLSQQLNYKFQVIDEPIDQWQTIKQRDQNLLDLFYKDPQRWGYTFQSFAFFTRIMHWQNIKNKVNQQQQISSDKQNFIEIDRVIDTVDNVNQNINQTYSQKEQDNVDHQENVQLLNNQNDESKLFISERSIYSDKYLSFFIDRFIFAKNSHECNFMNDAEMLIYDHWFNYLTEQYDNSLDGIIYLRTTPEVCLERCQKRNRSEETTIQLDYLKVNTPISIYRCLYGLSFVDTIHYLLSIQMLNDKHDQWLIDNKKHNVLVLDVAGDIINDKQFQQSIISKVQQFISNIKNRKNN